MNQKDIFYFSHDSNASEDPKLVRAEKKFGDLAYCWFFKTLERLRTESNLRLKWDDVDIIHDKVKCPSAELYTTFIKTSKLFDFNDEEFWSSSLIGRIGNTLLSSRKKSKAADIKWLNFYRSQGNDEKVMQYLRRIEEKQSDLPALEYHPSENIQSAGSPEISSPAILITEPPKQRQRLENIVLPEYSFILTPNAETSWKACLMNCQSSFDEIQKIYPHISEAVFISYQKFNRRIDDAESDVDLRTIRIANTQVDLQSYKKLFTKYNDRTLINDALAKMIKTGIKPEHTIYTKIEQFIPYVQEDRSKPEVKNKISQQEKEKRNEGVQLHNDGYYYINGIKQAGININDMAQCRARIKRVHNVEMTDEEIKREREQRGDKHFKYWME